MNTALQFIGHVLAPVELLVKSCRTLFRCGVWIWLGVVLLAGQTQASFHFWEVSEIYSSADGTVQFIELRALLGGQQSLGTFSATIRSTNSAGTSTFTCTTNLPADSANKTCIFGTANLGSIPGGVVPNYIIPPNFIRFPIAGGNAAVIFNPNSSTAFYTNLPSDGDSSLVRSNSSMVLSPTNSPKNFNNESNSIVPVKIQSIQASGNDFIFSFATATGINGTPGPNYAVEFNTAITNTGWQTLTNVAGAGATTNVTDFSPSDLQRFYRLRVP